MTGRNKYAIIVAAGSGTRMGGTTPKQFLEIDGKPILRHTIERFLALPYPVGIIVVINDEHKDWWKKYCVESEFLERYAIPSGGITRFHSVANALQYLPDDTVVAVHDGVRPFVTPEFLEEMFRAGEELGNAVPAVPPVETVREVTGGPESYVLRRDDIRLVQTPQVFRSEVLKAAYRLPYDPAFTDDASVVEAAGYRINLVPGLRHNDKITTPEDLEIARLRLAL
ncbi:MAG: 2-C-methyl-D-erythritol 4-phosphate cytidylyltransferase [Bacteroidales bacterium]|nr:2-C-methyl-D-erythritol 4-phosphate cytidylyltransferase [Bacteroidales bacterium]